MKKKTFQGNFIMLKSYALLLPSVFSYGFCVCSIFRHLGSLLSCLSLSLNCIQSSKSWKEIILSKQSVKGQVLHK